MPDNYCQVSGVSDIDKSLQPVTSDKFSDSRLGSASDSSTQTYLTSRTSSSPTFNQQQLDSYTMTFLEQEFPGHFILCKSAAITRLMSVVRAKDTNRKKYVEYSNRVIRLLVEESLARLEHEHIDVETPCEVYKGCKLKNGNEGDDMCAISIVRSGNVILEGVREVIPDVSVGHVLVQRDENDPEKKPIFFYDKFPANVKDKKSILLCDPMLATGGSAIAAIQCLEKAGISTNKILFLNLICAPEGVRKVLEKYPEIVIVSAEQDEKLNEAKFIVPGLGDFGDRYYGTG